MRTSLFEKCKESVFAVLPVAAIVLVLCLFAVKITWAFLALFLFGALLLILGMSAFTTGADISMMKIGESIGSRITKTRNIPLIAVVCLLLGVIITIAEPDLRVLAESVPIVETNVMIWAVAIGVGIFLAVSFFRVYLQIKLSYILLVMYALAFILALTPLIPNSFLAAAFDSGGVTTGPITVPFIMALGVGLASVRSDKNAAEDSFGLVALCSIGPILTVLLLGAFNDTSGVVAESEPFTMLTSGKEVLFSYLRAFPHYAKEVAMALLPIVAVFVLFQITLLRLKRTELIKISIGLAYTYFGLVLFLVGVNVGFMPMGSYIGKSLGGSSFSWLLVPLGAVIGWFIVAAEPAVHVLKEQVEDVTEGAVKGKTMGIALAIGVAISVSLALLRVLTGMSIFYIIIPGYVFSLIMTFFVPPIYTAIAFDAGGVASGPMTATFLLPLALGACEAVGGNMLTDAFGLVAFVAMTPLVTIQLLGLIAKIKGLRSAKAPTASLILSDAILDFEFDETEECL